MESLVKDKKEKKKKKKEEEEEEIEFRTKTGRNIFRYSLWMSVVTWSHVICANKLVLNAGA
jgi:hypothetical protein